MYETFGRRTRDQWDANARFHRKMPAQAPDRPLDRPKSPKGIPHLINVLVHAVGLGHGGSRKRTRYLERSDDIENLVAPLPYNYNYDY